MVLQRLCAIGAITLMTGGPAFAQAAERPDARVRVEQVEGGTVLMRDMTGDYAQHPKVFAEMMRVRDQYFQPIGDCFGIYPIDPDTVSSPQQLRWSVGVRVDAKETQRSLATPPRGYRIEKLPAVEAAVIDTNVQRAATDGLALIRWMVENGYVQIAPTRMEYRSHEGNPMLIPTKIIVPIKKRRSGLRLPS